MSRLVQAPPKFLHQEWQLSNHSQYHKAEVQRSQSEQLILESQRLVQEIERSTRLSQKDVNKKIDQRIEDIKFWKKELESKLEETVNEIEVMLTYKTRLEKAIESCKEPMNVAQQCLLEREKRVGIDLVHDDLERELIKETEVIHGVSALLQRTLEQTNEQIRLNRSIKYYLEKDLENKFHAQKIDEDCAVLTNNTPEIHYSSSIVKPVECPVTPGDWEEFSNANILKADKEKKSSLALRALIDNLLQQTASDMRKQQLDVNRALQVRIQETKNIKDKLEEHLGKVMEQIRAQETSIDLLKKAIAEKEGPIKVAQTRMETRLLRPNVELCHDPAHYRLIREVQEISTNVERLEETLVRAEAELRGLVRSQLSLEEDIQVKANTLYIDEVLCAQMRSSVAINTF
ncbi:tektin-1 [Polypterus senegalus]